MARITACDLLKKEYPPEEWLVDGLLGRGMLAIIGGTGKIGKSWLGLQMAHSLANQNSFLDRPTKRCKVLYFAIEDGDKRIHRRMIARGWKDEDAGNVVFAFRDDLSNLDTDMGKEELEKHITEVRPDVVVLDSFTSVRSGKSDENGSGDMAELWYFLSEVAQRNNLLMVVVHHHGKSSTENPLKDLRGSSAIGYAADIVFGLYCKRGDSEGKLSWDTRDSECGDVKLEFKDNHWVYLGTLEECADKELDNKILDVLKNGECTKNNLCHAVGGNKVAALKRINYLIQSGSILPRDGKNNSTLCSLPSGSVVPPPT